MQIFLGVLLLIGLTIGTLIILCVAITVARWLENLLDRRAEDRYWRRKGYR